MGFSHAQVETAAEVTTQYLKSWTDKQLQNLVFNENVPVCLPIGNHGFLIGRFKMYKINKDCWRLLDYNGEQVNDFGRKLSAVFYALVTQVNQLPLASKLLTWDTLVAKLEVDQDFYLHTIKSSLQKQDYFRADMAQTRHLNTKMQLAIAVEELEKTINTAKYLKVQEKLL
jgi:hypothetical protein